MESKNQHQHQGTWDFVAGYNGFGSLKAQVPYIALEKKDVRRVDFYTGFYLAKELKAIEKEKEAARPKGLSRKQKRFISRFAMKYTHLTPTRELYPHIDACFQVVKGNLSIPDFEKKTGIILEEASIEDNYQIGW